MSARALVSLELLKKLEWIEDTNGETYCKVCDSAGHGHDSDCELDAAIQDAGDFQSEMNRFYAVTRKLLDAQNERLYEAAKERDALLEEVRLAREVMHAVDGLMSDWCTGDDLDDGMKALGEALTTYSRRGGK